MKLNSLVLTLVIAAGPCCREATADGGQVRASERHGEFLITVFTSPNPLRAGPIDVSVLIQDAESGAAIVDATTSVELTSSDPVLPPIRVVAIKEAATNKLLSAALIDLPAAGQWNVRVNVAPRDKPPISISFTVDAAAPLPSWLTVWPWFSWPFVVISLFVVHRGLVTRRMTQRLPDLRTASNSSHLSRVGAP